MQHIPDDLYNRLKYLGIIPNEVRSNNVGESDYSKHLIQPWSIWAEYNLDPWDADIIKRTLRTKEELGTTKVGSRIRDYEKIIHICKEKIRQLEEIKPKSKLYVMELDEAELHAYLDFRKKYNTDESCSEKKDLDN